MGGNVTDLGADTPQKLAEMAAKSEAQQAQAGVDYADLAARVTALEGALAPVAADGQPTHPWAPPLPHATERLQHAHAVAMDNGDMGTVQRISFELARRALARKAAAS